MACIGNPMDKKEVMFSAEVLITPYSSETKSLLFCECTKITKACVRVHVFCAVPCVSLGSWCSARLGLLCF